VPKQPAYASIERFGTNRTFTYTSMGIAIGTRGLVHSMRGAIANK
jgi:hypothetical protein